MGKLFKKYHGKKKSADELDELEWMDFDDEIEYEEAEDEYYEEDGEDEEIDEEDEYYEDEDEDEEVDEEDEYYEDEEEDEYYEDDGEDEEIDEDEYYEEDEEDEEDDEYYEDEEDEKSGFAAFVYKLTHLPTADYAIALTGVVVLVLAVVTGSLYLNSRNIKKQVETFAEIGVGLEDISLIGEQGLVAIADAQAAKLMAASMEEEPEEEEEKEQDEDDNKKAEVLLNLSSIQKDLKIKFVDSKTGKLIPNIAFEVEIERPSGETYTKKDEDKDGIIYQTEMEPGKY